MMTTKKMGRNSGKSATPTTSTNDITLTGVSEPRVDSRLLAQRLSIQHKAVMATVRRHEVRFKRFGILPFKKAVLAGRGQPERYALLNEDQAYFLLSLSRNTDVVVELKARLVLAFREARRRLDIRQKEYLPTYHALHDEIARLAGDSANERFVHINVNKAINQAVGIDAGQRNTLPLPGQSLLAVAQSVAAQAMAGAPDHHQGYRDAKTALERFNAVTLGVCHG